MPFCHAATLEWQLQRLEEGVPPGEEEDARGAASTSLNALFADAGALERAVDADGGARRELWRKKATALAADALALRRGLERYLRVTHAARREARERSVLLAGAAAGGGAGAGGARADAVTVDAFLAQRASLDGAHAAVDEYAASAGTALAALRAQRGVLKGAHRRALDLAAALGLSAGVLRLIERRLTGDRVIAYGGMAALTLLLFIVWRYT